MVNAESTESTVTKSITAETIEQTVNQFSQQWIKADVSQLPWTLKHQDQQVSVHCQTPKEEPVVVKAVLTFPDVEIDVLLAVLLNHNSRTEWDSLFSSVRLLATDGDTHWVYFQLKSQMGVGARRDMCQKWTIRKEPSTLLWTILIQDAEHVDAPLPPSWLRVKTQVGGYSIRPIGAVGSVIISVNQSFVGGSVPRTISNAFACKAPVSWHKKLRKHCLKRTMIS